MLDASSSTFPLPIEEAQRMPIAVGTFSESNRVEFRMNVKCDVTWINAARSGFS